MQEKVADLVIDAEVNPFYNKKKANMQIEYWSPNMM